MIRWRYRILFLAVSPAVAGAANLRIVSFNTQADVGISNSVLLPNLATEIEGIGQQQYAGDGILKLPDIIALQETTSNTTTVDPIVSSLNTYYSNPNLYARSSYQATQNGSAGSTGNGPNALIYNQTTLNLMDSDGVGTPMGYNNGEYRQIVRYEFQPLVDKGTQNGVFYVYDSHYKSGSASTQTGTNNVTTDGAVRNLEARIIRDDEATLPASASVIYLGDLNMDGSTEAAYQTLTAPNSYTTNSPQGQGVDPLNPTDDYTQNWGLTAFSAIQTESDISLSYRDDLQLMTGNVYNGTSGSINYITNSFHAFGNNGTTKEGKATNNTSNTALNDLNNVSRGTLTSATVLAVMNSSIGSDHLPAVADYTVAGFNNGIWTGGVGNWSNFTFWTNELVPNSSSIAVEIDNGNSTASIVTLDQTAAVGSLTLDAGDALNMSSGTVLTLSGSAATVITGTLTNAGTLSVGAAGNFTLSSGGVLRGNGTFINQGTSVFSGSQNWSTGSTFNNNGGTATLNSDAGVSGANLAINDISGTINFTSTQHLLALNISSAALVKLTTTASTNVLVTSQLSIAGTLDLTTNALDVSASSLAAITALVRQGYNPAAGGSWNGSGITSSTAAANTAHLTALGVIQNNQSGSALFTSSAQFEGISPGAGDVLVKYTYFGDTDLNGKVDGSDYGRIDSGYLNNATGWFNGDFNYDGVINGSDYTLIDNSYNTQGAQLSTEVASVTAQIARSAPVPEPTTLAMAGMTSVALLRRRLRGHRRATSRPSFSA